MQEFDELLSVAEKLLGPQGCPWDQTQTFLSLQPYVLEEAHEVIDAVDKGIDEHIIEELGDLLYTIVFYGKLAQKEERFTMKDIINAVKEKLIRRHPHVFEGLEVNHVDEIIANWEKIKKQEKGKIDAKSRLDGIPPTLPLLARSQKIIQRIIRDHSKLIDELLESSKTDLINEESVGKNILHEIIRAENLGIDVESALRRAIGSYESRFRTWEMH